jgi:hypothetical protein
MEAVTPILFDGNVAPIVKLVKALDVLLVKWDTVQVLHPMVALLVSSKAQSTASR